MNKVYYKEELVDSFENSEIDFDLYDYIGFDYEKHDDRVEICNHSGKSDAYPMEIDKMIYKLQEMKSKGATHVSIGYHMDHIGYLIDGWKVSLASKDEIKSYEDYKLKRKDSLVEKRKEQLRKELKEIENLK